MSSPVACFLSRENSHTECSLRRPAYRTIDCPGGRASAAAMLRRLAGSVAPAPPPLLSAENVEELRDQLAPRIVTSSGRLVNATHVAYDVAQQLVAVASTRARARTTASRLCARAPVPRASPRPLTRPPPLRPPQQAMDVCVCTAETVHPSRPSRAPVGALPQWRAALRRRAALPPRAACARFLAAGRADLFHCHSWSLRSQGRSGSKVAAAARRRRSCSSRRSARYWCARPRRSWRSSTSAPGFRRRCDGTARRGRRPFERRQPADRIGLVCRRPGTTPAPLAVFVPPELVPRAVFSRGVMVCAVSSRARSGDGAGRVAARAVPFRRGPEGSLVCGLHQHAHSEAGADGLLALAREPGALAAGIVRRGRACMCSHERALMRQPAVS